MHHHIPPPKYICKNLAMRNLIKNDFALDNHTSADKIHLGHLNSLYTNQYSHTLTFSNQRALIDTNCSLFNVFFSHSCLFRRSNGTMNIRRWRSTELCRKGHHAARSFTSANSPPIRMCLLAVCPIGELIFCVCLVYSVCKVGWWFR